MTAVSWNNPRYRIVRQTKKRLYRPPFQRIFRKPHLGAAETVAEAPLCRGRSALPRTAKWTRNNMRINTIGKYLVATPNPRKTPIRARLLLDGCRRLLKKQYSANMTKKAEYTCTLPVLTTAIIVTAYSTAAMKPTRRPHSFPR